MGWKLSLAYLSKLRHWHSKRLLFWSRSSIRLFSFVSFSWSFRISSAVWTFWALSVATISWRVLASSALDRTFWSCLVASEIWKKSRCHSILILGVLILIKHFLRLIYNIRLFSLIFAAINTTRNLERKKRENKKEKNRQN